tara:strand:- start:340 stop:681 length:342 start_codon:yes stop_codon:yes gene_type:complete
MTSLGSCLKSLRKSNNLTLKYIEDNLGISNAYLSQLENDKIKSPSIYLLTKLSNLYEVPLAEILEESGIVKRNKPTQEETQLNSRIAFSTEKMSKEEKEEVLEYLKFLKSKRK